MNSIRTNYSNLTQKEWGCIRRLDVLADEISRRLSLSDPNEKSTMSAKIVFTPVIYYGNIGKHFLLIED